MAKMAVLQDIDKCVKCRACQVACQRNWPRHQNPKATMLVASGSADKISVDDPTVVKAQRLDDRAPFVKYNCWHCPSPPCVEACKATGRGAMTQNADGSVHIEQHSDPTNPWDRQWCDPTDPKCRDLAGRLVCVTACQRGAYPRRGKGDGVNDKIYKCTLCGQGANKPVDSGRLPGDASMWIGTGGVIGAGSGYAGEQVPACVATCPARALLFGTRANVYAYATQIDNTTKLADDGITLVPKGTPLFPYKAGHSPYPDRPDMSGGYVWVSRNAFGHPTGDPYVEDHAVPMLEMLVGSPAGKMVLVPALVAGGLYALYERKKARATAGV